MTSTLNALRALEAARRVNLRRIADGHAPVLGGRQVSLAEFNQRTGQDWTVSKAREALGDADRDQLPVAKAAEERRYTLAPMYIPDRLDYHGEFTDAEELQKALWGLIRSGDRRIRLQHNTDVVAGELVEAVSWPYPTDAELFLPDGTVTKTALPAGTVFNGIVWEPWAWQLVKSGRLRGLSMGGKAKRVTVDFEATPATKALQIAVAKGVDPELFTRALANVVAKHLQGKHNQKDHAGKKGAGDGGGGQGSAAYDPARDPRNTDKAYGAYTKALDAKLAAGLDEHGSSKDLNFNPETQQYTPERRALHAKILAEFLDEHRNVPADREVVVLAGPPGAGKSTTLRNHGAKLGLDVDERGNPTNSAVVNPDDFKERLIAAGAMPGWVAGKGIHPNEAATVLHEESSDLSKRALDALTAQGKNVVFDGTFSGGSAKQFSKVQSFIDKGYTAKLALVDGDVNLAVSRAASRHRKGPEGGPYEGRYVSADDIIIPQGTLHSSLPKTTPWDGSAHKTQNSQNFVEAASLSSSATVFDTSGNIVATSTDGGRTWG